MIQKYTCVPIAEYDLLIVTNGYAWQVENALREIRALTDHEFPQTSHPIYLDSFKDMVTHLKMDFQRGAQGDSFVFPGTTLFMFFNGIGYVSEFICEVLDHNAAHAYGHKCTQQLVNSYFYFDSSVAEEFAGQPMAAGDSNRFLSIVTIANDVLKKVDSMVTRVRGVFLDDVLIEGERVHPLRALVRNFPKIERVELTSHAPVMMI